MIYNSDFYTTPFKGLIMEVARRFQLTPLKDECGPNSTGKCSDCVREMMLNQKPADYRCARVRLMYLIKYLGKYKKEFEKAVELTRGERCSPYNNDELVYVSLGCGPATDLWGFLEATNVLRFGGGSRIVKFYGYDMVPEWLEEFNLIRRYLVIGPNTILKPDYIGVDIGSYEEYPTGISVLALQYFISSLYNSLGLQKAQEVLLDIYKRVKLKLAEDFVIIANDVNREDTNIMLNYLTDIVPSDCRIIKRTLYNESENRRLFEYGEVARNVYISENYPDHIRDDNDYGSIWFYCNSSQLIITGNGNDN
jgi:hypothetical protein